MKRIVLFVALWAICLCAYPQSIVVKSFSLLPNDVTATSETGKRNDQNGDPAALIKVKANESGYFFDAGLWGVVATENLGNETWVWVSNGLEKINILHSDYGVLRDYVFPVNIVGGKTYSMLLSVEKKGQTPVASEGGKGAVQVTVKVDADAEIYVNGKLRGVREWTGQVDRGLCEIECRQPGHETSSTTFEVNDASEGKVIYIASPRPIFGSLRVESDPSQATVLIDGKHMGTTPTFVPELLIGNHEVIVSKEGYATVNKTVVVGKDDITTYQAVLSMKASPVASNKPSTNKPSKVEDKPWFATVNVALSNLPTFSFGFTVGHVEQFGWFVSAMTNAGFKSMKYIGECDKEGYIDDNGHLPQYSGKYVKGRLSVMAGGIAKINDFLFGRVGVGYGMQNLCWETKDGAYYRNKGYSASGVDVSAGLQVHYSGFVISLEAVTTQFKTLEGKLGLGLMF